jgi:hypothetical protein
MGRTFAHAYAAPEPQGGGSRGARAEGPEVGPGQLWSHANTGRRLVRSYAAEASFRLMPIPAPARLTAPLDVASSPDLGLMPVLVFHNVGVH